MKNRMVGFAICFLIVSLLVAFGVYTYRSPDGQIASLGYSLGYEDGDSGISRVKEAKEMFAAGKNSEDGLLQVFVMTGTRHDGTPDERVERVVRLIMSEPSRKTQRVEIFVKTYNEGFSKSQK